MYAAQTAVGSDQLNISVGLPAPHTTAKQTDHSTAEVSVSSAEKNDGSNLTWYFICLYLYRLLEVLLEPFLIRIYQGYKHFW